MAVFAIALAACVDQPRRESKSAKKSFAFLRFTTKIPLSTMTLSSTNVRNDWCVATEGAGAAGAAGTGAAMARTHSN